ncbi:MAG TPA: TIGR04211 family SH3 domain-containing protein [Cellvibrionaceae bacterium]
MNTTKALLRPLTSLLALVTVLLAADLHAADRYVSDELLVPLRAGMGGNYRIVHRGLTSGTKLELLEEAEDDSGNPWAMVRTEQGLEGWIRAQYLLAEPTAARKLETLTRRMSQLDGDQSQLLDNNEQLETANAELTQQLAELQQAHEELIAEHTSLRQLSANAVTLNEQYKQLNENYQLLQTRAEVLTTENERLASSQRFREWIFGAVLLFCGVILSLILQSLGKRKRQSEWR